MEVGGTQYSAAVHGPPSKVKEMLPVASLPLLSCHLSAGVRKARAPVLFELGELLVALHLADTVGAREFVDNMGDDLLLQLRIPEAPEHHPEFNFFRELMTRSAAPWAWQSLSQPAKKRL